MSGKLILTENIRNSILKYLPNRGKSSTEKHIINFDFEKQVHGAKRSKKNQSTISRLRLCMFTSVYIIITVNMWTKYLLFSAERNHRVVYNHLQPNINVFGHEWVSTQGRGKGTHTK